MLSLSARFFLDDPEPERPSTLRIERRERERRDWASLNGESTTLGEPQKSESIVW
jgi:hypothetical protein